MRRSLFSLRCVERLDAAMMCLVECALTPLSEALPDMLARLAGARGLAETPVAQEVTRRQAERNAQRVVAAWPIRGRVGVAVAKTAKAEADVPDEPRA